MTIREHRRIAVPVAAARSRVRSGAPVLALVLAFALSGCSTTLSVLDPGTTPRDAEGRPIAPGPAPPSTCVTPPTYGGASASCVPVHNPPSKTFVEQAINTLLPTRGYGPVLRPRCTERIAGLPSEADPTALYEFSHWTCVGREPESAYLHEDVIWTPASGYLNLNAVTRDRSPAQTVPLPNDPGLPDPHASEEPEQPSTTPRLSQHDLAAH